MAEAELYTRTSDEAELYMRLHPCACGEPDFRADLTLLRIDGVGAIRYEGDCVACGLHRDFCFRYPDGGLLAQEGCRYGPPGAPSRLLDAGEWLLVADLLTDAGQALLTADDPSNNEIRTGRDLLAGAVEAAAECLKFVPPGADSVPDSAVWSEPGLSFHSSNPERFDRSQLVADLERRSQLAQAVDHQIYRPDEPVV
jgi:hypothetical protein